MKDKIMIFKTAELFENEGGLPLPPEGFDFLVKMNASWMEISGTSLYYTFCAKGERVFYSAEGDLKSKAEHFILGFEQAWKCRK